MKHHPLLTATIAATILSAGCTRTLTSRTVYPDVTSVSVRFVLPTEQVRYSEVETQNDAQLASDTSNDAVADQDTGFGIAATPISPYHAALWGGQYDGTDVTMQPTALAPGSYTFALFDQPNKTAMQGWLDIRNTGSDMASILTRWRDGIADQKRQLAYDLDIDERMRISDPDVFKSFKKQMQAYNQLESRLEASIKVERRANNSGKASRRDLLRDVDVVIMPGEDSFFNPTTNPAFSEKDLEAIRNGDSVTKIVLAADYAEAQWKLSRINKLYDDLARFREVLRQEADRLERRKGWLRITDHLYKHGKRFVENEIQLQNTLSLMGRFQQHASDLRERRMGLAFVTSLFTPGGSFTALDQEERDLYRERTVLETERKQMDRVFDDAEETSARRVTIERRRQDVMAMVDAIDNQIDDIQQARTTLASMIEATDVIHRHNDTRLLTTTFVADSLPPAILRIVEGEAMMTVRMRQTDDVFVPRSTSIAFNEFDPRPIFASKPVIEDSDQPDTYVVDQTYNDFQTARKAAQQNAAANQNYNSQQTAHANKTSDNNKTNMQRRHKNTARTRIDPEKPVIKHANARKNTNWQHKPEEKAARHNHPNTTTDKQREFKMTARQNNTPKSTAARTVSHTQNANNTAKLHDESNNDGCPWYVRMVCPPCWFDSSKCDPTEPKDQGRTSVAANDNNPRPTFSSEAVTNNKPKQKTRKADTNNRKPDYYHDERTENPRADFDDPNDESNTKGDCPWYVRMVCPPCWFDSSKCDSDAEDQTSVAATKSNSRPTFASEAVNDKDQQKNKNADTENRNRNYYGNEPNDDLSDDSNTQGDCPWYVRMVCPPCWFDSSKCDPDYQDDNRQFGNPVID